jgi:hypothetical protein
VRDQDQFRQAILAYYENQAIDNLIRAYLGLPIVQMDYTTVSGTVTDTISATLGGNYSHQKTDVDTDKTTTTTDLIKDAMSTAVELTLAATKQIIYVFNYSLTGSRGTQLAVTAKPVIDDPGVYQKYLQFLAKAGSLVAEDEPPAVGLAHIQRQFGAKYYYVPVSFKKDFFRLVLKTTVMRGEPEEAPLTYSATVVNGVVEAQEDTQVLLRLQVKPEIPNDFGSMKATIPPGVYQLQILSRADKDPNQALSEIRVGYNQSQNGIPLAPQAVIAALRGKSVDIALAKNHPQPKASRTDQLLDSIYSETLLQRLDRARLAP